MADMTHEELFTIVCELIADEADILHDEIAELRNDLTTLRADVNWILTQVALTSKNAAQEERLARLKAEIRGEHP
jgi:hypothetical protein